jgi:hypothetical protein
MQDPKTSQIKKLEILKNAKIYTACTLRRGHQINIIGRLYTTKLILIFSNNRSLIALA